MEGFGGDFNSGGGCGGLGLPAVGMERFGGGPSSWEERGSGGMEGCLKWSGGLW